MSRENRPPLANIDLQDLVLLDDHSDSLLTVGDVILKTDLHAIRHGVAGIRRFRIRNLNTDTKQLIPGIRLRGMVSKDNPASSIISKYGIAFETIGLDASLSQE